MWKQYDRTNCHDTNEDDGATLTSMYGTIPNVEGAWIVASEARQLGWQRQPRRRHHWCQQVRQLARQRAIMSGRPSTTSTLSLLLQQREQRRQPARFSSASAPVALLALL